MDHMGQKLRELLEEKKIKQKELAEKLKSSPQYVQGLLGKKELSYKVITKLAKALDVDVKMFFETEEEDNKQTPNCVEEVAPAYLKGKSVDFQNCEKYIRENSELKSKIIRLQDEIIELKKK
jgi:transcriptional regulator with XRE-family HTH domain